MSPVLPPALSPAGPGASNTIAGPMRLLPLLQYWDLQLHWTHLLPMAACCPRYSLQGEVGAHGWAYEVLPSCSFHPTSTH